MKTYHSMKTSGYDNIFNEKVTGQDVLQTLKTLKDDTGFDKITVKLSKTIINSII